MIKIRMSRGGRKNEPVYTIVATDSRCPRDSKYIEKLGRYAPKAKEAKLVDVKIERIHAWMKEGAVLSDTVRTLFKAQNIKV
jgi:small subunit ribosomal protein S16